ncbi:MAG: helix-turn-helix transcriptional regulator [Clostridia bacterium]|nr:helix-turn-helix transcriptional regulator [Clostridia bacterium]
MELIRNEEMLYLGRRMNLEIDEIRYALLDSEWNLQNLRASFTRVYFPLDGEGILTFGNEEITIRPGNIYIVPSELNFSGFCPKYLNKIYVHLTLRRPDGNDLLAGIDRCLVLPHSEAHIAEVEELYRAADLRSVLRLKQLLYELLLDAIELAPPRGLPTARHSPQTKAALAYIDEHLRASLTIDEIASALFVSKLGLQKSFREEVGKPIGKYVDDCLMARAERDLLNPAYSIKEISDRLGFCDQFYFSRKFTQSHGMSPRRFRQMQNE